MRIEIKPKITYFTGSDIWHSKWESVILVKSPEDIEPLFKLLVEQDDYFTGYKHLIKVAPNSIESVQDLDDMCSYCGKTDIWDLEGLQKRIDFIIYQYYG